MPSESSTSEEERKPRVGLDEGATVYCACGWFGWVHPEAYSSPSKIERECPDCGRLITVEATVNARYQDTENQQVSNGDDSHE